MPEPLDPRNKPTDVKVHVTSGSGVDVVWGDGHSSHYEFAFLRDECPCATCNDRRQKEASIRKAVELLTQTGEYVEAIQPPIEGLKLPAGEK